MAAPAATAVVEDLRYRAHRGPGGHPERPERLAAVHDAVAACSGPIERLAPREATEEELLRVHSRGHVEGVADAARQAPRYLDPDTYVSPESYEVARLAAGACVDLARRVARGDLRNGLAAVRPPGHHAEGGRAMGFCLFNNVAVAARALQMEEGVGRILIVDWDVHHGNGTQHSFEEDPSVLYFSTHQYPYYPGTGSAGEVGRGRGEGTTVNVPLPAGCGDAEYVGALARVLGPVARSFRPEMILVSCGFDAHREDPLGGMEVSEAGFSAMAHCVRALADEMCAGRLVCVLEGGYSAAGLHEGTRALLGALLAPTPAPPPPAAAAKPSSVLAAVLEHVRAAHGTRYRDLGSA
jgi:acetoin utilization deacetylase AcuC-like enzyme